MASIPTEQIGSIPRPPELIDAVANGSIADVNLDPHYEAAVKDTIERLEATGSPIVTDGEQRKYHNFWTYSVEGLSNTSADGFAIPFSAGHVRRMPRLTSGPFHYQRYADSYLDVALKYAHRPLKQAVISPSALSLMYPAEDIAGYSRDRFIEDLLCEHEKEIRRCLKKGAVVQKNVLGLDIAVDDVVPVRVIERTADFSRDPHGVGDRKLSFDIESLAQRLSLDVRHHIVRSSAQLAGVLAE